MTSHFVSLPNRPLWRAKIRDDRNESPINHYDSVYYDDPRNSTRPRSYYVSPSFNRHVYDQSPVTPHLAPLQHFTGESQRQYGSRARSCLALPLDRALLQLYTQVGKALRMYTTHMKAFSTETSKIRLYATPDILNQLWELKMHGGTNSRNTCVDECLTTWHNVKQAVDVVLTASLDNVLQSSTSRANRGSAERLRSKVRSAGRELDELWKNFFDDEQACNTFIKELEELKRRIDLDASDNKAIFRRKGDGDMRKHADNVEFAFNDDVKDEGAVEADITSGEPWSDSLVDRTD